MPIPDRTNAHLRLRDLSHEDVPVIHLCAHRDGHPERVLKDITALFREQHRDPASLATHLLTADVLRYADVDDSANWTAVQQSRYAHALETTPWYRDYVYDIEYERAEWHIRIAREYDSWDDAGWVFDGELDAAVREYVDVDRDDPITNR